MLIVARGAGTFAPLLLLVVGCGQPAAPLGQVAGQVKYQGEPLTAGSIVFENQAQGVALAVPLGGDGRYEVASHDRAGLPPGDYQVALLPVAAAPPTGEVLVGDPVVDSAAPPSKLPPHYLSTATSNLTANVQPGPNTIDFDLP